VLLLDAPLTMREFMTKEDVPLATLFRATGEFLAERPDAVLFGAHAVNAYCEPERMTQDVDILSTGAADCAEALRAHLARSFHVATRVREVVPGLGFRVYQLRDPKNRHLADVRQVVALPEHRLVGGIRVVAPAELVALKVAAMVSRENRPKGDTDRADLRRLLLAFPELRLERGVVLDILTRDRASERVVAAWSQLVTAPLEADVDDDE